VAAENEADPKAATKLHQLISRVTTQRLGYQRRQEVVVHKSAHQLFDKTREITSEHLGGRHVDTDAWYVINTRVRPFTSKWHRQSEREALDALDATDVFRAKLIGVQQALSFLDTADRQDRAGAPHCRRHGAAAVLGNRRAARRISQSDAEPINEAERRGADTTLSTKTRNTLLASQFRAAASVPRPFRSACWCRWRKYRRRLAVEALSSIARHAAASSAGYVQQASGVSQQK
jgi:hypothetical protein